MGFARIEVLENIHAVEGDKPGTRVNKTRGKGAIYGKKSLRSKDKYYDRTNDQGREAAFCHGQISATKRHPIQRKETEKENLDKCYKNCQ